MGGLSEMRSLYFVVVAFTGLKLLSKTLPLLIGQLAPESPSL